MTVWQRAVSWVRPPDRDPDRPSLGSRLSSAMLKPAPEQSAEPTDSSTLEELEATMKRADDKERLIGLIAAPLAGMVAVIVTSSLIAGDPAALTTTGQANPHHVNPSLYLEVGTVALVLSGLMLAMALWRKRLYLGITMALYGLSIFNLHFWGFGLPFILAGAWYLVRSYRIQQKVKVARAEAPSSGRGMQSKRYTPPSTPRGKPRTTGGDERQAG